MTDEASVHVSQVGAGAENMILVDAVRKLTTPNPAAADLVAVTAFIQQYVVGQQAQCFGPFG